MMIDDVRYLEFRFLSAIATGTIDLFDQRDQKKILGVTLPGNLYLQMAAALAEDLFIRFNNQEIQLYVSHLRGELAERQKAKLEDDHQWNDTRDFLESILAGHQGGLQNIRITYRGLRRIQELRDLLRYDRILEPHGILLSMQYFRRDLEDALKIPSTDAVSVISADMDDFKRINTDFGHDAGDVVMKAYLESVRDGLGLLGTGYRGVGDEVLALVTGQGHKVARDVAESIRARVAGLQCEHKGKRLHSVTASLGVATTPPEPRTMDIETVAKERGYRAKRDGKNQVVVDGML